MHRIRERARAELVARVLVAKRHVAQLHVPVAGRQLRRVRRVGEVRLAVEQLEDAGAGRGGALGEVEGHAERAHRRDQHVHVQVEGGELAEREVGVDHFLAAQQQHRREPELGQEADHRVVLRFQARGDHRLAEDATDGFAKARQLPVLARERLDDADARDVLLGVSGQLGDALLRFLDRRACAAPVAVGDHHHERDRNQRQQAELGIDHEHHRAGERDREDRLQDEHEPVAEEEAHGREVDGRA